jgi:hypothetical protein
MRKEAINTFSEGLNFDLNPLTTPNNVLTDCVNGTFITFNGDEMSLQNDAGNTKISLYPNATAWISGATYTIGSIVFDPNDTNSYYKNLTGNNNNILATDTTN